MRSSHSLSTLLIACVLALGAVASPTCGQEASDDSRSVRNAAWVSDRFAADGQQFDGNPDILVRPGMIADRREQCVTVYAEATGLAAGEPAEFILIARESGHGYESVAFSYARPSDIHRGLEFIGLEAGLPFNPQQFRFWPKGPMIAVSCRAEKGSLLDDDEPRMPRKFLPVDRFLKDLRTEDVDFGLHWMFTGSIRHSDSAGQTEATYAADTADPRSILSTYSETQSVLDVPYQAFKGAVYGSWIMHPRREIERGALTEFRLSPRPLPPGAGTRPRDVHLEVGLSGKAEPDSPDALLLRLHDSAGKVLFEGTHLAGLVAAFGRLTKNGDDPYLSVTPDDRVSLQQLHDVYAFLSTLESAKGIRMEPPHSGHVYFQAFLPTESFRDRATRPSQPWELHLSDNADDTKGTLIEVQSIWNIEDNRPLIETTSYKKLSPEEVENRLTESENTLKVLLVFAPGELPYRDLLRFVRPLQDTHPIVYVFLH